MLFLILFLVFVAVAAACWFHGLWSCAITIINITLAGLIATNFWEPLAQLIEDNAGAENTHLYDAPVLWGLFIITFIILRSLTGSMSQYKVVFIKPVEYAGRSILAIWCGWVFTCFAAFTLLTAPVGSTPMGSWSTPNSKSFLFLAPERQWLAFAQSRSQGALARGKFTTTPGHPDDQGTETFDPFSEYTFKYYHRRSKAD
jgi:hypothetical protein